MAFNQILASVCAAYARCRWDGRAVYNYQFSASQASTLDFFHPSLILQPHLLFASLVVCASGAGLVAASPS